MTAIVTFGLASITSAQVPSYVPTSGLVGWWPFNGNAKDESGNGNNGTVNGATLTTNRFGSLNSAYSFSLNKFISGNCNKLPTGNRTIAIWFNSDNIGGTNGTSLLGYGGGVCGTSYLQLINNPGNGGNQFEVQGHCNNQLIIYNYGANNHPKGSWFHWLVTSDSIVGTKFYLNGNQINSDSSFLNQTKVINKIFIFGGSVSNDGNRYYYDGGGMPISGKLDDIGIWNRALDSCEIKDLYFGSTGNCCSVNITPQPTNQIININNNAQFTVGSSDSGATYQWQTDLGVGFQNLKSVGQYSGTTNDTLTVSNVTMSNNNQPFRCIISSGSCSDTSSVAVLTVNNNVGINESANDNLFSVFPNPARSVISIKADSKLIGSVYSIYDNTGRVLLSGKLNAESTTIELGNLSGGIYMFGVGKNMTQTFKVIKE